LLLLIIALIDGLDGSDSQQLRERFGVIVIGLVAILDQLVMTRIADRDRGHQGLDQLMQPSGMCAFFKDHFDFAAQPAKEVTDIFGFGFNLRMALHLAERIQDDDYGDCLMDIHAHILNITHRTPP
jgi:hypothetical protein